jgi:hypothetical protein
LSTSNLDRLGWYCPEKIREEEVMRARELKAQSEELKKLEVRIQKSEVKSKGRGFPALYFLVSAFISH